ncbi:MAG: glycoside hydrolase family 127 protein [Opitutaceae bacterium]|nr:glycoside hydrolase family 127 protein [Opitutaceae bacterium]
MRTRYRLYRTQAETEHHANFNWFGRPEWTEPCAIVDAFLLVVQLWSATGEADYLEEAHRIFFNALAHAQRPNGGYGCDLCTGGRGLLLVAPHEYFEAPWCCSMRGTEGLVRAAQFGWFTDADEITLPFFFGGAAQLEFADGRVELRQQSDYPLAGRVQLQVAASTLTRPKTLRFFAPSWSPADQFRITCNGVVLPVTAANGFAVVTVELSAGDGIVAEFPLGLEVLPLQNPARLPGYHRFGHGPLLLGHDGGEPVALPAQAQFTSAGSARYRCTATGRLLAPLPALIDLPETAAKAVQTQILFTD